MSNAITFNFSGCHVLITGGTSGIGLACAHGYHDAGAQVTVTGRKAKASDYNTDLHHFEYRQLDVANRPALLEIANDLSQLDILINNAGGAQGNEWEADNFDQSLAINLSAAFHLSSACKELLAASDLEGGASIVSIASMTSFFGHEFTPGYGPAKAGIVQMTKTLGMSWGKLGIRANAVAAGLTQTGLTDFVFNHMEEMVSDTVSRQGIKRTGLPQDIAAAVLFLSSPAASWITGQTLPVDGGFSTGMN